jgi:hypothetical protein
VLDASGMLKCPYEIGDKLRVVLGGFAGSILRVSNVFRSAEGWKVTTQIERDGVWVDFCTEPALVVAQLCERI